MGQKVAVKYKRNLLDEHNSLGMAFYQTSKIELQDITCEGINASSEKQEEVFLHELVHHILYSMGESDLRNNEKFVGTFSGLLHQALTTAVYKDKE